MVRELINLLFKLIFNWNVHQGNYDAATPKTISVEPIGNMPIYKYGHGWELQQKFRQELIIYTVVCLPSWYKFENSPGIHGVTVC